MQLVLNTFGASLHQKERAFEVVLRGEKTRLAPESVSSIVIGRGCRVSSDAVHLAIMHEIDVLFVDNAGHPHGRVSSARHGNQAAIRKRQVLFAFHPDGLEWVRALILRRLESQNALARSYHRADLADTPLRAAFEEAFERLETAADRVRSLPAEGADDFKAGLRGIEGAAAKAYFRLLSELLPAALRFKKRSRRPARDPFNSLLNYYYGCLYGRVETALATAGLDPYCGLMHAEDYNRPVLAFDFIERYRVWAETCALEAFRQEALGTENFVEQKHGVWLGDAGKKLALFRLNEYLDEIVPFGKGRASRLNHILGEARDFAAALLKWEGAPDAAEGKPLEI